MLAPQAGEPGVAQAVTALFVPGDRPDRIAKAAVAGADVVVIDLEDAVAPDAKTAARDAASAALSPGAEGGIRALVRINATDSRYFGQDRAALLQLTAEPGHGLLGVMVAKAEDPARLAELGADLRSRSAGTIGLIPLVESALGLVRALDMARTAGVIRLAFGGIDFALDVGADDDSAVLDHARSELVVASRAGRIAPPLDSPSTQIKDLDAVARSAATARRSGFGGKLCIHPAQLGPVRRAFMPTDADVAWARSVLGAGDSAEQIDGQMIDRPVLARARAILRLGPPNAERIVV